MTADREISSSWPGDTGVYRVARRNHEVFAPADWEFCGEGRFDDPSEPGTHLPLGRFRTIYCATDRIGALGEVLGARGASVVRMMQNLLDNTDDDESPADSLGGTFDPQDPLRGLITEEWRSSRHIGHTYLDSTLRFADITTASTLQHLRRVLASDVVRLKVKDLDLSSVTGPQRELTQLCARYIYEQVDSRGEPLFAGIRFLSHFDARWECWTVFADRIIHDGEHVEKTLYADDGDLLTLGRIFRLTFEVLPGTYVRP